MSQVYKEKKILFSAPPITREGRCHSYQSDSWELKRDKISVRAKTKVHRDNQDGLGAIVQSQYACEWHDAPTPVYYKYSVVV